MAVTSQRDTAALDARYGRTPQRARRDRLMLVLGAIAFAIVFLAWVVWAGLDGTSGTMSARDIGHVVNDEYSVNITWEVSAPAGTAVSCALQAQNEAHGIVGWKIVELPASDRFTRTFTEQVRTTELAVTGLIYRCWLT